MSEWRPIETYDALDPKKRPKFAVFYFEATKPRRIHDMTLPATVQTTRTYGYRTCTKWLPFPDPEGDA